MSRWEDEANRHAAELVKFTMKAADQGSTPLPENELAQLGKIIATERQLLIDAMSGLLHDDDPEAAAAPGVAEFHSLVPSMTRKSHWTACDTRGCSSSSRDMAEGRRRAGVCEVTSPANQMEAPELVTNGRRRGAEWLRWQRVVRVADSVGDASSMLLWPQLADGIWRASRS